jgi:F0F1-type ATP synthase assembly protein I
MNSTSSREQNAASADAWVSGSAFLGSILSGTLIGFLADLWLGTDPWLVVVGIVVGSYSGFARMWHLSKAMENGKSRMSIEGEHRER